MGFSPNTPAALWAEAQATFLSKQVEDTSALRDGARIKMPLAPKRLAFLLAAALLCAPPARALIIYGTGPTDVNNALNITAPASGAPWAYVFQFGTNNASGIYLGNGYILTANHVLPVPAGFFINGLSYDRDTTFAPLQVTEGTDVVDMKLVKILPNVTTLTLPPLSTLPLNFSPTADLNLNCTLIGWGVGKGAIVTNQGWDWGDDSTRAQRWGTNKTLSPAVSAVYSGYSYEALETSFNRSLGSNTAEITIGDSGSGLFQQFGGVWKLSGLTTTVLQYQASAALYDGQFPLPLGDQPDAANFVRLEKYAYLLRYENWANTKLGSSTASATADPDKDGLNNLLEYAFHTDPNAASVTALPQVGMESGYVTLTYTKLMSATDLSYVVEQSASLSPASWSAAPVTEVVVATSGVTATIKAKVAITTETQKFLRLSVTKLP